MSEEVEDKQYLPISKGSPEALLKRLLEVAGKEHGTPQGLMLLRGQLNKRQYAACNWFEQVYERYLAAIDKSRGIRTSTGERYDRGHDPDPLSDAGKKLAAKEAEATSEYNSARLRALEAGAAEFSLFWDIIIDGNQATSYGRSCVAKVASLLDKKRRMGFKGRYGRV